MPRVVPDQKQKFENDELFRKLQRETEVKYTAYRDRTHDERVIRFQNECREAHSAIAFVASGTNLNLTFPKDDNSEVPKQYLDFDKEPGKVHIKSHFILNGVCVLWKGWIDLQRLDGLGYLEFDEEKAQAEDKIMRETMEQARQRMLEFEERQKMWREEQERKVGEEQVGWGNAMDGQMSMLRVNTASLNRCMLPSVM